jgi:hypothetical protein
MTMTTETTHIVNVSFQVGDLVLLTTPVLTTNPSTITSTNALGGFLVKRDRGRSLASMTGKTIVRERMRHSLWALLTFQHNRPRGDTENDAENVSDPAHIFREETD